MTRRSQRDREAAAAGDRICLIHIARAARVQRIQNLHYPEFLARYPVSALPIPPLVVGSRAEWEQAYRTWRDAVLFALREQPVEPD